MAKPKTKGPRTRCGTCGLSLTQAGLKQHVGRRPCVERYWSEKFLREYPVPSGHSVIHMNDTAVAAYDIVLGAGISVEESPVQHRLVASGDLSAFVPWPTVVVVAPFWLVTVADVIRRARDDIKTAKRYRKRKRENVSDWVKHWLVLDTDALGEEVGDILDRAIVVLKFGTAEARLGLGVRFNFERAASHSADNWRRLVAQILRDEAQYAAEAV